jgi:protein NrfD
MIQAANDAGRTERPSVLRPSPKVGSGRRPGWAGPTYYGRPQLKSAPFNNWVVGSYIFIAGLSGSASLLGGLADLAGGRDGEGVARRARWLSLLVPTVGSALLIQDLHTPKRFYNMLRVAKARSPMSIGTWILMAFSAGAFPAAIAHFVADRFRGLRWLRGAARWAQAPATLAGAGLSVYTAPLMSATSTPSWASAPRALAVRYAASSMASAAAALMLGERSSSVRQGLALIAASALATEAVALTAQDRAHRQTGVEGADQGPWGRVERIVGAGVGIAAPLTLFATAALARAFGRREAARSLGDAAAVVILVGSVALRISTLGVGDESADRPEISLRFAQPANLP